MQLLCAYSVFARRRKSNWFKAPSIKKTTTKMAIILASFIMQIDFLLIHQIKNITIALSKLGSDYFSKII